MAILRVGRKATRQVCETRSRGATNIVAGDVQELLLREKPDFTLIAVVQPRTHHFERSEWKNSP